MNTAPRVIVARVEPPAAFRILRSALAAFLGLAFAFIVLLAVGRALLAMDLANSPYGKPFKIALGVTMAVIVLAPLILVIWAERQRRIGWIALLIGWLLIAPVLGWLAWDDPAIRRPLSTEEIAPTFDGANKSFAVLMRYSKQSLSTESRNFSPRKFEASFNGVTPAESAKWREFLTSSRAALGTDWNLLAPQRAWLTELNSFKRIGDLTPPDFDADIPRHDVWRVVAQEVCANASLQALDGHGDDAIATLLPLLEVSRKLEISARTLVRFTIARTVQRLALETVGSILDLGPVSPAARQRLAAALEGGNAKQGARRVVLLQYAVFTSTISAMKYGDQSGEGPVTHPRLWQRPLIWLSNLVFNFHATANRYGDFVYDLAALAEARDPGTYGARQQEFIHALQYKSGVKNLGGTLVLSMTIPAYDRILRSYWETEDLHAALLTRLKAPGP